MRTVSLMIALGIGLFVAALAIGFADNGVSSILGSVLGEDAEDGSIYNCNPADPDKNCPDTEESPSTENSKVTKNFREVKAL